MTAPVTDQPRSRISVELVPRSVDAVRCDVETVQNHLDDVDTINVPDLTKFELTSWDACAVAREAAESYRTIPHIRARDLAPGEALPMLRVLDVAGIDEVLIVNGDSPLQQPHRPAGVSTLEAIERLRRELPYVQVYAGLDPYRQAPIDEVRYAEQKFEAGATGFFTQPFFDTALMGAWAQMIPAAASVWWGATTVTSPGSLNYWQRANKVVFPADFESTLAWQRDYAERAMSVARTLGQHIYLMPVRVDLRDYLGGLLSPTGKNARPRDCDELLASTA
ncbi:MAG: methylenetetrahydrofolate reductase [Ornithinimicrobium sp.]